MFCNAEGALDTPRPDAGMCRDLRGEVMLRNTGGSEAHACQTVVPGSESMLIPNRLPVNEPVQIAIPDSASFTFPGTVEPAGAQYVPTAPTLNSLLLLTVFEAFTSTDMVSPKKPHVVGVRWTMARVATGRPLSSGSIEVEMGIGCMFLSAGTRSF